MAFLDEYTQDFSVEITNYRQWPHYSGSHFHNVYELYFLFSGSVNYIISNKIYEISENDILWIPPAIPHHTRPRFYERHNRMLFYILPSFLDSCFAEQQDVKEFFSEIRIIRPTSNDLKLFRKLSNLLLEEFYQERPLYKHAIKGLLLTLLTHLMRIHQHTSSNNNISTNIKPEFKRILLFIDKNFYYNLTLASLSEQMHLSQNYISSLFSKNLNCTFKKYLIQTRISYATKLLHDTNYSITYIAEKCGFNSLNHFCKTFKKYMDLSPKMYRDIDKEVE